MCVCVCVCCAFHSQCIIRVWVSPAKAHIVVFCRAAVSSVQTDGKQLETLEWTALLGVLCVCVYVSLYNGVAAVGYSRLFSH